MQQTEVLFENERKNQQKLKDDYSAQISKLEDQIKSLKAALANIKQEEVFL